MKRLYFLILLSPIVFFSFAQQFPSRTILKGTIVTPSEIIIDGYVVIEQKKITGIYHSTARALLTSNATYVDTRGIIFPGLIDLHNHITYDVFPPWLHGRKKFNNRYEWRFNSDSHQEKISIPYDNMSDFFCEQNAYGELRALIGGTTSMLSTAEANCIRRLVRNLDDPTQLDGRQIESFIDITNHSDNKTDIEFENELSEIKGDLKDGTLDAFLIHLAEGKVSDAISAGEFEILEEKGLLSSKTAIIHGIALGGTQFQKMQEAGTSLIWSPRSNIDLYGQTTDVVKAKTTGVRIAIAPDWAVSGSRNILEELQYAAAWNKNHLNNYFTDKDLVEMVTTIPAAIAGAGDKIGAIEQGYYADLLVIRGDALQPYSSLIKAGTFDVKLVFINGQAIYGTLGLMKKFWSADQLDTLHVRPTMMLKLPLLETTSENYYELRNKLAIKMFEEHTTLAPLFTGEFFPPIIQKPGLSIKTKPPPLQIPNKSIKKQ